MVWYSHLLKNFPQFVVIHTVKDFGIFNKAKVDVVVIHTVKVFGIFNKAKVDIVVIHTLKDFGIFNKAKVDVFLELFFDDPVDVGNLISDSSAFSKSSLNIWKFSVYILLKPGLENFEYYLASV